MGKNKSFLGKVLTLAGAFVVANFAGGICIGKLNEAKMKENENANNFMHSLILKKGTVDIAADTQFAYITCLTAGADITVPVPEKDVMTVEITSLFSDIKIHVPQDVKVTFEGPNYTENTETDANITDADDLPKIHFVTTGCKASKVAFVE